MENIRIDCQMDAGEFEELLYTIFSEEPFKNQRIHVIETKNDHTISDFFLRILLFLIGESMKFLSCHQNKRSKLLRDYSFVMSFG